MESDDPIEQSVLDIILDVRILREQANTPDDEAMIIVVEVDSLEEAQILFAHKSFIEKMANCKLFFPHTAEDYAKMVPLKKFLKDE